VAVEQFWEQLPNSAMALELMTLWNDKKSNGKAQ